MRKIMVMATLLVLVFTGCSMKSGAWQEHSMSGGSEMTVPEDVSKKQLHTAILSAGEKSGWKMTEFKNGKLIAERLEDEESASATISYGNEHVVIFKESASSDGYFDDAVEDLQDAIEEELQVSASH